MPPLTTRYNGYRSYSYLEAGADYDAFELALEINRVPPYTGLDLTDAEEARAARLLAQNVVISLHDHPVVLPHDVRETRQLIRTGRERTGFEGLAQSGLTALFDNFMDGTSAITSAAGWKWTDVIADLGMRFSDIAHQDFVVCAEGIADIHAAHASDRLALVPALEASTMIENELDRIDVLYGLGVRQMGIAYNQSNMLGSGIKEARDGGLTRFGRAAITRMNKLGMAIDITHSGDITSLDVIEHSTVPVFITHSGSRAVWNSPRMKPDHVISACAEQGGIIGIEAAPNTSLSAQHPRHTIDSVMDHFAHLVDLVGIEHVAFGPDTLFGDHVGLHSMYAKEMAVTPASTNGGYEPVPYVDGLENPGECFRNIVRWLVKHDYSDAEITAVTGENILRVLSEVWA